MYVNRFFNISISYRLNPILRDRLKGQWGITDVTDSVNSVKELAGSDKVDPKRITITGGSAGGYTVLNSMCTVSDVFAAGTSSYGISNLFNLATGTHKFESRYLDGLLGGTPDEVADVYKDRSPYFHADKIKSPLLVKRFLSTLVFTSTLSEIHVRRFFKAPSTLLCLRTKRRTWSKRSRRMAAKSSIMSLRARAMGGARRRISSRPSSLSSTFTSRC